MKAAENAVWVNLYGGNTLDTTLSNGSRVQFEQQTRYPWSGDVRSKLIECDSQPVVLKLRIPAWANSATLNVDNTPVDAVLTPGT